MPWELFSSETSGDINTIWERQRQALPRRISFLADNIQLLHRSAEDAKRDAKQWAAQSGDGDPASEAIGPGMGDGDEGPGRAFRSDGVANAIRLIDVLRTTMGADQVTAGSKEISRTIQQLSRFHQVALRLMDEPCGEIFNEQGPTKVPDAPEGPFLGADVPGQGLIRSIKSQQRNVSKERERMIQGIQSWPDNDTTGHGSAVHCEPIGFGEQGVGLTSAESGASVRGAGPSTSIRFGPSTSFSEAGRQLAEAFTLNER